MATLETENYIVSFADTPILHKKVFDAVIDYYKKHEAFNGECICQSDDPVIDAPHLLAAIADDIIQFGAVCKDDFGDM